MKNGRRYAGICGVMCEYRDANRSWGDWVNERVIKRSVVREEIIGALKDMKG